MEVVSRRRVERPCRSKVTERHHDICRAEGGRDRREESWQVKWAVGERRQLATEVEGKV